MTDDDLRALRDATHALTGLVERLSAHVDGHRATPDDLDALLRESGPAAQTWVEVYGQGVATAHAIQGRGVARAPADPSDPAVDLTGPVNSA